jgi:recombination protein RecT
MSETRPQLVDPRQGNTKPVKPIEAVKYQLDQMGREFSAVLPQHIPIDRFRRVVMTALNQNPDLLIADRRSLLNACIRAAQDGLLPDGREGALVIFNTKMKVPADNGGTIDKWIKAVQWMPMVYGIIKKMRQSGELSSIVSHEVYKLDHFDYELGDDEFIKHKPHMDGDPGPVVAVYAIARLKDGTIQREVLPRWQIEEIRKASKTADSGPWVTWFGQMSRKSAIRRLSKFLPMSTEIEDMLRRDDAIAASADTMEFRPGIDDHSGPAIETTHETVDPETGEVTEPTAEPQEQPKRRGRPPKQEAQQVEHKPEAPMQTQAQREPEPAQQDRGLPQQTGEYDELGDL